jgi:hypothetical protein
MYLEKDGIRVEVIGVQDAARLRGLGYREVIEELNPEPAPAPEPTPDQQNADAIQAVNESDSGSKTKGRKS